MAARPWMPLYVADYLKATRQLTTLEHGAYLLLIMEYWTIGSLPDDDARLARIVGISPTKWRRIRTKIQQFFYDGWKHERIEAELKKAGEISAKRKNAVNRRHHPEDTIVSHLNTHARASSQSQSPSQRKKAGRVVGAAAPTPKPKQSTIPPDFILTPALKKEAEAGGHRDAEGGFRRFRIHHEGRGTKSANWPVMWTGWWEEDVRRDHERRADRADPNRAPTVFVHYGDDGLPRYSSKQPAAVTYGDDGLPRYSS